MSKTRSTGGKRRKCGRDCSHCNPEGMRAQERKKQRHAPIDTQPDHGISATDMTPRQLWLDSILENM